MSTKDDETTMTVSSPSGSSVTVTAGQLDSVLNKLEGMFTGTSRERDDDAVPIVPHLASEFMLFLWHLSETSGGVVDFSTEEGEETEIGDSSSVDLWIDERMGFRARGDIKISTLCTGETPAVQPESKIAVIGGKVLGEIRVGFRAGDDLVFAVTLKGDDIRIHGAGMPHTISDGGDGLQGDIHDRMYLIEQMDNVIAKLFCLFAKERVNGYATKRGAQIQDWLRQAP